jgi:hypothetical protein
MVVGSTVAQTNRSWAIPALLQSMRLLDYACHLIPIEG